MQLNRSKSGILTKRIPVGTTIKNIPVCKDYKYLGVLIDSNLGTGAHLKYLRLIAYRGCIMIRRMTAHNTLHHRVIMMKMLILPIIDYARPATASTIYKSHENQLQAIRRKCMRLGLGLGYNVKNDIVNSFISSKNLKLLDDEIIEVTNLFNRVRCKTHEKRLTSSHLKEHCLNITYTDIHNIIQNGNKNLCNTLKIFLSKTSV